MAWFDLGHILSQVATAALCGCLSNKMGFLGMVFVSLQGPEGRIYFALSMSG